VALMRGGGGACKRWGLFFEGRTEMCESVFKVLLIGDHSVGKTSFVASYVLDKWVPNLKATVGADYAVKCIKWTDTETVRLHVRQFDLLYVC
jgi:hypothetical protein